MKIYLDVCCYKRPFDSQTQERVRLETEAVLTILNRIEAGALKLVSSEAVRYEVFRNTNTEQASQNFFCGPLCRKSNCLFEMRSSSVQTFFKIGVSELSMHYI